MSSRTLAAPTPNLSSGVFTDMPSRDAAVSVRGLSKSYTIARNAVNHTSAGEAIMHRLRHPFEKAERDTFWALNDVSFDIQKGDVVGIIGRNGAGKSTLLKILSRITAPTKGRIDLYGRVGSLLEVGTGFHPELTGRENIFLNGAILGMQKSEIARQFAAIVEFSGTEQFLDTPVKRYSSGMYVRLAFAVAAHLNPEILIIDEVLAVGDAEFQKKCLGKMQDVADSGRTVLFVSHNIAAVRALCTRGIFLQNGRLTFSGNVETAVTQYLALARDVQAGTAEHNGVRVVQVGLTDADSGRENSQPIAYRDYQIHLKLQFSRPEPRVGVVIAIRDDSDNLVSSICTPEEGIGWQAVRESLLLRYDINSLPLYPGKYWVGAEVHTGDAPAVFSRLYSFEVQPEILRNADTAYGRSHGCFRIATSGRALIDA